MKKLLLCVIASALLSSACAVNRAVLPDPRYPHQVAKPAKVEAWCRLQTGTWEQCLVQLREGDFVASKEAMVAAYADVPGEGH